jgi:hypothetical protein
MEPEWNISDCCSDSVILGLRRCEKNSYLNFLNNRSWFIGFSFKKRVCYVSGQDITWKKAYVGRKKLTNLISKNKPINDDIWISTKSFQNLCYSYFS